MVIDSKNKVWSTESSKFGRCKISAAPRRDEARAYRSP